MARPQHFGPGRLPLLRQKKHARRLNKITSVKIAGRVGTVIFQTLLTVNINMISRSESRRRAISGESESWEPVHDGLSPSNKQQAVGPARKCLLGWAPPTSVCCLRHYVALTKQNCNSSQAP